MNLHVVFFVTTAKSWGGLKPIKSFFFLFISRFNNKMCLQSSLPLELTQAYKDQIVIPLHEITNIRWYNASVYITYTERDTEV